MNYDKLGLFIEIVEFASIASIVIMLLLQKLKSLCSFKSKTFKKVSFVLSIICGYLFANYYSDFGLVESITCGIVVAIGADSIYKALESKNIVSSIKGQTDKKIIEIPLENEIEV